MDKTGFARRLADDAGKHYFLSRPRRFGKSLFVDTLKELFEGSEELFRGLAVHDCWNWSKRFPVVRLSSGSGNFKRPGELLARVTEQLADLETDSEWRRPREPRPRGDSRACWRRCTARPERAWWCW